MNDEFRYLRDSIKKQKRYFKKELLIILYMFLKFVIDYIWYFKNRISTIFKWITILDLIVIS